MRPAIVLLALCLIVFSGCNTPAPSEDETVHLDLSGPSLPADVGVVSLTDMRTTGGPDERAADAAIRPELDSRGLDATTEVSPNDSGLTDSSEISDTNWDDAHMTAESSCPAAERVDDCPFGFTTRSLRDQQGVIILSRVQHATDATLTPLESAQLINGFNCDGIFLVPTVAEAFALIDAGGVTIHELRTVDAPQTYHWFQFYQGDTEVGFIFQLGVPHPMAIIGDGDISICAAANR